MSDFIIGLTGGIGSGKTTVANIFAEFGVNIIDADIIARDVVAKGSFALSAISDHFGSQFIQLDGNLDRALLRKQIFSNEADKQWLNKLLHPLIRQEILSQTKASSSPYCIIVAPLLIENKLTALVNRILVIDVDESTQLKRTTARDNNSTAQVQSIMNSQIARQDRQLSADDLLNNDNCSIEDLRDAIALLHQAYLDYAANTSLNKK